MFHSRAYASARCGSRLATATSWTFFEPCAPGMTFRLMSAVEMITKPTRGAVLYRHVTPVVAELQRIGPIVTERPYPSVVQRSDVWTQSGPMSPRHEPIVALRLERLIVCGSQSRSQLAGLLGLFSHVALRTRHWTKAGEPWKAGPPMQLMFPDGDWKWTSPPTSASLIIRAITSRSYAS